MSDNEEGSLARWTREYPQDYPRDRSGLTRIEGSAATSQHLSSVEELRRDMEQNRVDAIRYGAMLAGRRGRGLDLSSVIIDDHLRGVPQRIDLSDKTSSELVELRIAIKNELSKRGEI